MISFPVSMKHIFAHCSSSWPIILHSSIFSCSCDS